MGSPGIAKAMNDRERALAEKYRKRTDEVDNAGYQRLATILHDVAAIYDRDAKGIISNGGVPLHNKPLDSEILPASLLKFR